MILHELISYETLRLVWWLLLGVLLIGFAVTDGFDLGANMLLPFAGRNDLEPVAVKIQPVIAEVLSLLREANGCTLARMSGSGATCFALYENTAEAQRGADKIRRGNPGWWVHAGTLS